MRFHHFLENTNIPKLERKARGLTVVSSQKHQSQSTVVKEKPVLDIPKIVAIGGSLHPKEAQTQPEAQEKLENKPKRTPWAKEEKVEPQYFELITGKWADDVSLEEETIFNPDSGEFPDLKADHSAKHVRHNQYENSRGEREHSYDHKSRYSTREHYNHSQNWDRGNDSNYDSKRQHTDYQRDWNRNTDYQRDGNRNRDHQRDGNRNTDHQRDWNRNRDHQRDGNRNTDYQRDWNRDRDHQSDGNRDRYHQRDWNRDSDSNYDSIRQHTDHQRDWNRDKNFNYDSKRHDTNTIKNNRFRQDQHNLNPSLQHISRPVHPIPIPQISETHKKEQKTIQNSSSNLTFLPTPNVVSTEAKSQSKQSNSIVNPEEPTNVENTQDGNKNAQEKNRNEAESDFESMTEEEQHKFMKKLAIERAKQRKKEEQEEERKRKENSLKKLEELEARIAASKLSSNDEKQGQIERKDILDREPHLPSSQPPKSWSSPSNSRFHFAIDSKEGDRQKQSETRNANSYSSFFNSESNNSALRYETGHPRERKLFDPSTGGYYDAQSSKTSNSNRFRDDDSGAKTSVHSSIDHQPEKELKVMKRVIHSTNDGTTDHTIQQYWVPVSSSGNKDDSSLGKPPVDGKKEKDQKRQHLRIKLAESEHSSVELTANASTSLSSSDKTKSRKSRDEITLKKKKRPTMEYRAKSCPSSIDNKTPVSHKEVSENERDLLNSDQGASLHNTIEHTSPRAFSAHNSNSSGKTHQVQYKRKDSEAPRVIEAKVESQHHSGSINKSDQLPRTDESTQAEATQSNHFVKNTNSGLDGSFSSPPNADQNQWKEGTTLAEKLQMQADSTRNIQSSQNSIEIEKVGMISENNSTVDHRDVNSNSTNTPDSHKMFATNAKTNDSAQSKLPHSQVPESFPQSQTIPFRSFWEKSKPDFPSQAPRVNTSEQNAHVNAQISQPPQVYAQISQPPQVHAQHISSPLVHNQNTLLGNYAPSFNPSIPMSAYDMSHKWNQSQLPQQGQYPMFFMLQQNPNGPIIHRPVMPSNMIPLHTMPQRMVVNQPHIPRQFIPHPPSFPPPEAIHPILSSQSAMPLPQPQDIQMQQVASPFLKSDPGVHISTSPITNSQSIKEQNEVTTQYQTAQYDEKRVKTPENIIHTERESTDKQSRMLEQIQHMKDMDDTSTMPVEMNPEKKLEEFADRSKFKAKPQDTQTRLNAPGSETKGLVQTESPTENNPPRQKYEETGENSIPNPFISQSSHSRNAHPHNERGSKRGHQHVKLVEPCKDPSEDNSICPSKSVSVPNESEIKTSPSSGKEVPRVTIKLDDISSQNTGHIHSSVKVRGRNSRGQMSKKVYVAKG